MANNVRFLDNVSVSSYGGGGGGDSISSSYALSASHADFATTASFAISASHEIIKEVSSSYADTASFAQSGDGHFSGSFTGSFFGNGDGIFSGSFSGSATNAVSASYSNTASYVNPLQQDVLLTGSLNVSGSVDIEMPEGSAFTIHEADYPFGVSNRLDFNFNNGDPILEIASRSTTSSLHLKTDYTGQGLLLTSNGFLKYITGGNTYGVQLTTEFKPEDTTGAIPLGNYNRRWADLYLFNGKKISFGTNASPYLDLVSFRHTAGTNTLVMSGSSDVLLDVKGNIDATGVISASKFTVNSGSSALLPGYTFHHDSGTGLYSANAGDLQFQLAGGGTPEISLTTGQATFRVPIQLNNNELINPSRIRGLGSISASGDISSSITSTASFGTYLGDGSQLEGVQPFPFTGDAEITGSLVISGSGAGNLLEVGSSTLGKSHLIVTDNSAFYNTYINGELYLGQNGVTPSIHFGSDNIIYSMRRNGTQGLTIGNTEFNSGHSVSIYRSLEVGRDSANSATLNKLTVTGSAAISGSTGLEVHGSGSTVFNVIGSAGTLFEVTDSLTGSIFAAKDATGIPILEVFANGGNNDTVEVNQAKLLIDSGSLEITGSINVSGSVINNLSASYALTASHALSSTTANAGTTTNRVAFTTAGGELTTEAGFEYNPTLNQLTVDSINAISFTSSFITSSTIQSSGSHVFGDETTDTQTLVGSIDMSGSVVIDGNTQITGSLSVSGSNVEFYGAGNGGANRLQIVDGQLNFDTTNNSIMIGTDNATKTPTQYGSEEIAIGRYTGHGSSATHAGNYNVYIGGLAGYNYQNQPQRNIGIGVNALGSINGGDYNIGIGNDALGNGITGNYNIAIGRTALYGLGAGTNNIRIGDNIAVVSGESYQLKIGDGSIIAISASLQTGDIIFPSTASADYFVGDGSQLTGIEAGTNLTQSIFVSPSGNDGTAAVGNMSKPFQTILAATSSANIGDTIFVYPGTYLDETSNIVKDGVNYYFYPGAFVSSSNSRIIDTGDLTYPINFRGNGSFETDIDGYACKVQAPSGMFEFDLIHHKGNGSIGSGKNTLYIDQPTSSPDGDILEVKGTVKTSDGGNGPSATLAIGNGNTKFDGVVLHSGSIGKGIDITDYLADTQINAYVYAKNGNAFYTNDSIGSLGAVIFNGTLETGDESNYHAVYIGAGNGGTVDINGEIKGAIYLSSGGANNAGVTISGQQRCLNSPNSFGAVDIRAGKHILNQKIIATETIFHITGSSVSNTIFNGQANIISDASGKFFDIDSPGGRFVWNGIAGDLSKRALSNNIVQGELVINNDLYHYGQASPAGQDMFDLSGGTLEINSKIKYFHEEATAGIVNMTGGYLKLNGAQLIHTNPSVAQHCIYLNNTSHSGSIFNNSFTNIPAVFQSGSFTNEIVGGGTLFYSDKLY